MEPNVCAITLTGARPEAWELCQKFMRRQTRQPNHWVIVDDCDPQTAFGRDVWRPSWRWQPAHGGKGFTVKKNVLYALEIAKMADPDVYLFFEDDDWYGPRYIQEQVDRVMDCRGLGGEYRHRVYNVRFRTFEQRTNRWHCSLCGTGFHRDVFEDVYRAAEGFEKQTVDTAIWKQNQHLPKAYEVERNLVGIKGMPGRRGVVGAHNNLERMHPDPEMKQLAEWIGEEEARQYAGFCEDGRHLP